MKNNNVKKLVNKVVNEEFVNKIKEIKNRIFENKEEDEDFGTMRGRFFDDEDEGDDEWTEVDVDSDTELDEGFDDPYVKRARGGKDFSRKEFRPIPKDAKLDMRNLRDDSVTPIKYMKNQFDDISDILKGRFDDENEDFSDFDGEFSEGDGETCECGGMMYEGECEKCGKTTLDEMELDELGGMDDGHPRFGKKKFPKKMTDDEIERILKGDEDDDSDIELDKPKNIRRRREEMGEGKKLSKGQQFIAKQAEPKDKIDAKDFAKLRAKKTETKEGKKFPDLSGDGKVTRKDVLLGRGVKLDGKKKTNESEIYQLTIDNKKHYFTESEMVDVIEKIVNEEKKKGSNPTNVLKSAQGRSKDENEKNIAAVTKKMKEYLENASKGDFEMNPKHFPKGNGELGEMSKKAYKASTAVEEYVENFTAAALENIDYDDIKPNEKWVEDNIVGSSKTGNNPEWANAVETEVNEKRNKIRKDNLLAKMKKKAYNKAPQPVNDEAGENTDKASKIMMKLESVEEKKVINEIEKMKNLIGYNQKTQ